MNYALGTADAWDALVYGEKSQSTVDYLRQGLQSVGSYIADSGRKFLERAQGAFEKYHSEDAIRFARNAAVAAGAEIGTTRIIELKTLPELMQSPLHMQRWIMADATIRAKYHKQLLDGYSDTYVDMDPGRVGELHYDYRRVNDAIVTFDDKGEWLAPQYLEDLREGDRDLLFEEQLAIIKSQAAAAYFCQIGDDPTNASGGKL